MQAVLVRISARLLKKTLLRTDERAKLEGELLDGMDVVKCMTWEVGLLTYMLSEQPVRNLPKPLCHQCSQVFGALTALPVHDCMCCHLPLPSQQELVLQRNFGPLPDESTKLPVTRDQSIDIRHQPFF